MLIDSEIKTRVLEIHRGRNKNIWFYHLLLLFLSLWSFWQNIFESRQWLAAVIITATAILIHGSVLTQKLYTNRMTDNSWPRLLEYFSIGLLAVGWSLLLWSIKSVFGLESPEFMSAIIPIAGMITASALVFQTDRPLFYIHASILTLAPMLIFYTAGGNWKWLSIMVFVFYLFNINMLNEGFCQIMASVKNEYTARIDRDRLSKLMDTVPGYLGIFNRHTVCLAANKAAREAYPDLVGNKVGNNDPSCNWEKLIADFIAGPEQYYVGEALVTHKGHVLTMIRLIQKTEDGGAAYVTQNISELVNARNKLREQEAKAQYTSKLASLGEMAGGIAHEINNPLSIIMGASSIIQRIAEREEIDRVTLKKHSQTIVNTTERISKIIRSLKNLSRNGDHDPFQRVNLADVLEDCFNLIKENLRFHSIELRAPSFNEPVYFTGREVQIGQVFTNLFSNAIDAVKATPQAWIQVNYEQLSDGLYVYVSDSGPGIGKEILNKVMEPFFTTKDVNKGTGLGLSISKSIIDAHQGELTIVEDATHTTFRIRLPNAQ